MSEDAPNAAEVLAEETGEPIEKFTPPEDVEYPHPTEVEKVEVDDSRSIELTERQRERFDSIKAECTDEYLPEPTDQEILKSLMDTWDAVGDGHYSGVDDD